MANPTPDHTGYDRRYKSPHSSRWSPSKPEQPDVPNGCAWGRITCVPADHKGDVAEDKLPWGFWVPLVEEVFLRLECTPRSEKLRVPLASPVLASRFYHTLMDRQLRHDLSIELELATKEDVPAVYVRRGTSWK